MKHLIQQQILDVTICNTSDAFSTQHNLSIHYWRHLLPILEKIFNEAGSTEQMIRIDRIDVNLGIFTMQQVQNVTWDSSFLAELEHRLRSAIREAITNSSSDSESPQMAFFSQWMYYMKNGFLPWNSRDMNKDSINILETLATNFSSITSFRELLLTHPNALSRITLQYKGKFLTKLVEVLTSIKQESLDEFVEDVVKQLLQPAKSGSGGQAAILYRSELWQYILTIASQGQKLTCEQIKQRVQSKYLLPIIIERNTDHVQQVNDGNNTRSAKNVISDLPATREPADQHIPVQGPPRSANNLDRKKVIPDADGTKNAGERLKEKNTSGLSGTPPFANADNKQFPGDDQLAADNDSKMLQDPVYISLAGLVLVHPFLSTLFKKLKWIQNGQFIDHEHRQRALILLHYIGTGKTEPEEHELVSSKLLVDYPLQMPVPPEIDPGAEAFEEADHMIEALIAQWEVLKQTSADGLRQGFLQRNGKLYRRNERRYLQVESTSIDVLIDRLPWNLSIIKLPWMKDILHIEWR